MRKISFARGEQAIVAVLVLPWSSFVRGKLEVFGSVVALAHCRHRQGDNHTEDGPRRYCIVSVICSSQHEMGACTQ